MSESLPEGLFLRQGYLGTSMDQVAALATVSMQTVYKHFADKYQLFSAIVLDVAGTIDAFLAKLAVLQQTQNLESDLRELGRAYYERAPKQSIEALADCFDQLSQRRLLHLDDPLLAAYHFAYLVLAIPQDRALLLGEDQPYTPAELEQFADAAVRVFLAAYKRS